MNNKVISVGFHVSDPAFRNGRLFFDPARDNYNERFIQLKKSLELNSISLMTHDQCRDSKLDVLVFYDVSSSLRSILQFIGSNKNVLLFYVPVEPPVISAWHNKEMLSVMPFDRIFVWNDDLAEKDTPFVKSNIGEAVIDVDSIPSVSFSDKRFLTAIYSNKFIKHENGLYEERLKSFDYFSEQPEGLDLYGMGWDKSTRSSIVSSYRGKCEAKMDVLKKHKFSICFENTKGYPGLITEKIFDCFAAGTVPIYYGAPNIQDYIPNSCFIDFRDFYNYAELYQYLVEMTEAEYHKYLDAVKDFILTPEYYEFTSKRYAEIMLEEIQLVMSESKPNRSIVGFKWLLLKVVLNKPIFFLKNLKSCRRFLFDLVTVW